MTVDDPFGNPLTLADAASEAPVRDFVEGFAACEARVVNILAAAAHDRSPIVQAYAAALHLFAESPDGPRNARPFVAAALQSPLPATPRERAVVQAIAAWADGDVPGALRIHRELADAHPRDLASVKFGQYHHFNLGDGPGMLRLALAARDASADVCYAHGMAAFGYEQCHLLAPAEAAARRAIGLRRAEPWAHHALAHVMLTQGRTDEGRAFLEDVRDTWVGLNSFMVTHNWWHLCLFLIDLGRFDEVLAHYDGQVWGVARDYSQDQIGAVSLLARLELAGVDVGERWRALGPYLASRTADHVQPFLDLQYLYGLARAGLPQADDLMRNVDAYSAHAPAWCARAWREVAVPACRGLLAHARGDWRSAAQALDPVLGRLREIGGSHAQRDLFALIHLDALIRDGQLVQAQHLLRPRVDAVPQGAWLRERLAEVESALRIDR
jgi:hypothetical protein